MGGVWRRTWPTAINANPRVPIPPLRVLSVGARLDRAGDFVRAARLPLLERFPPYHPGELAGLGPPRKWRSLNPWTRSPASRCSFRSSSPGASWPPRIGSMSPRAMQPWREDDPLKIRSFIDFLFEAVAHHEEPAPAAARLPASCTVREGSSAGRRRDCPH